MRKSVTIVLIILIAGLKLAGQEIMSLLPAEQELPGWQQSRDPQVYDGDMLFELINGGADIYLEYGFSRVISVQYLDPSQNNVQLEIYQMTDDAAAYGIFSITQQIPDWKVEFGNISSANIDYLAFWKRNYYVNISWSMQQQTDKPSPGMLAELIADKIDGDGDVPGLLKEIMKEGSGLKTIYLKGNLALSNFYYFDYKDIFQIREGLAWLNDGYRQVIFRYADQAAATDVVSKAKQSMANSKRFSGLADTFQGFSCKDNKGNLILARQVENFLVILVGLDPEKPLETIMDSVSVDLSSRIK